MTELPTGYTPGPWRAGSEIAVQRSIFTKDIEIGGTGRLALVNIYSGAEGECEANAALIALAPEMAAALTPLQERNRKLEEAARAFVAKFDECKPHIDDAFVHRQMRVGEYKGPQVDEELAALRALLSGGEG